MSITSFPIPTTQLVLTPAASSFELDANLLAVQGGTLRRVPVNKLPSASALDVKLYGATGNGTTDDSAAIAACFAAAQEGDTIVFPRGTYLMRSYVTIAVNHLTVLGQGAKIISDGANQDRKFNCVDRTGIRFRDLHFDGLGLTVLTTDGISWDTYTPRTHQGTIHLSGSVDCDVSGCKFVGLNFPITIYAASADILVLLCRFELYYAGVYSYFEGPGDPIGSPAPKRVTISQNTFMTGIYPSFDNPPWGWIRNYPPTDKWSTGAIKFRGTLSSDLVYQRYNDNFDGHIIISNNIRAPGTMGIELQGVSDCVVTSNTIENVGMGISLSVTQRACAGNNVIKNFGYAGIEVDGRTDFNTDPTLHSSDGTSLTGNIIDARDDWGRPVNFVDNCGIICSHVARNVTISGGCIKMCKTGICVDQESSGVLISGVRIETNLESGTGGRDGYIPGMVPLPWVQGILIRDSRDVDIIGCTLIPSADAWQRMLNIMGAARVNVRSCNVVSNNTCVYIKNSAAIAVQSCALQMGINVSGPNPSFVSVDSTNANCPQIIIRDNTCIGVVQTGISLYSPAFKIDVLIKGNDTRQAMATGPRFLVVGISDPGIAGAIQLQQNIGGDNVKSGMQPDVELIDGNSGTHYDVPGVPGYVVVWTATINLQHASGYKGVTKFFINSSYLSSVTLHPQSGEKINGSTSDYTFTTQWQRVVLTSDGTDWIAST
jgi:hypothetical protein